MRFDLSSLSISSYVSAGPETLALHALEQLDAVGILRRCRVRPRAVRVMIALIAARMINQETYVPTSHWLCERSALPEMLDLRKNQLTGEKLFDAACDMLHHKETLESDLHKSVQGLLHFMGDAMYCDLSYTTAEESPSHPKYDED